MYSTAGSRCEAIGMESCDFHVMIDIDRQKIAYHWTSVSCAIQVKVNAIGQVALVYKPESYIFLVSVAHLHLNVRKILCSHFSLLMILAVQSDTSGFPQHPHVRNDNRNFFKVYDLIFV